MRYWILTGQDGCFGVCDADGTMWSKQWFDTVSNSELVKAFIEANGTEALSQNITANELKKAAMRLTRIVPAVPFTLQQATKNIQEMLNEYGQHQKITKVVFHGNDKEGGFIMYILAILVIKDLIGMFIVILVMLLEYKKRINSNFMSSLNLELNINLN